MKIVPFDLELAKKLKYPSKIETQNGGDIKIITFDSGAKYEPIVAVLNGEFIRTYYENGVSCGGGNKLVLVLKGEDEKNYDTKKLNEDC